MLSIEIPVRDGTALRGLHYSPDQAQAPTVLCITPYGADRYHPDGKLFTARGFHFVSIDSRGRGDSDGRFVPFEGDGADGHDVVEWIAGRPWSDGRVVMYGGSYSGFNQWVTAARGPEGLVAIAPVAAAYPGFDFPMMANVHLAYAVRWLTLAGGRRLNQVQFNDEEWWNGARRTLVRDELPFRDLDLLSVGCRLPMFQEWLDHPSLGDYWASRVPTLEQYRDLTLPVLTITGQYDGDQPGALRFHSEHLAAGHRNHHLVIGPWDHPGTRTGAREFGGLTFAEACEIDLPTLHADWYDWVLGRGNRPEFLRDRVVYFHEDEWKSGQEVPAGPEELVLDLPTGKLTVDRREAPDEPVDFTADLDAVDDGIVLIGEPLTEPVDVSGLFRAHLVLSADLPDFVVHVAVYLLRDGEPARLLGEAVTRATYRNSSARPEPWPVDSDVPVEVTPFPFTSFRAAPADRFAVVVGQPHLGFWQVEETGVVSLGRGSCVVLPVR